MSYVLIPGLQSVVDDMDVFPHTIALAMTYVAPITNVEDDWQRKFKDRSSLPRETNYVFIPRPPGRQAQHGCLLAVHCAPAPCRPTATTIVYVALADVVDDWEYMLKRPAQSAVGDELRARPWPLVHQARRGHLLAGRRQADGG